MPTRSCLRSLLCLALALSTAVACSRPSSDAASLPAVSSSAPAEEAASTGVDSDARDVHSFAKPQEARVTHVALDLAADFAARRLSGTATLTIQRPPGVASVVLDSRDLNVSAARTLDGQPLTLTKGPVDPVLGQPLTVALPEGVSQIVIAYATSPEAAALQWLEPSQTAGKRHPFLYSQGEPNLTRTWIPTQDSPGIRQTYTARITVPKPLKALMSAENLTPDGIDVGGARSFDFQLTQSVPPYLIALAVGDVSFSALGARTGVYAEPSVVDDAAREFAELEQMVTAAEQLLGPYRWGRYDVLVLPPSFAFGGMENPRLTFATPTVLAGDRSLVSLLAHELAHSWSGNMVTNATWRDFWLNEGITTYVENRIMEQVYGPERAGMLRVLDHRELVDAIEELGGPGSRDTILHVDLDGRDPDAGATSIPYVKGAAFVRLLERTFGRDRFDRYLRSYFERFAFQSITTGRFLADVREHLVAGDAQREAAIGLDAWVYEPGLPDNEPTTESRALEDAGARAREFAAGAAARELNTRDWSTQEWQHFLNELPATLTVAQLTDLDRTFRFSASGNSEVLFLWLRMAIRHRFQPAMPALERFLTSQGRRKFVKPLFEDLMAQEWGRAAATRIYAKARPLYHAVSRATIDPIVGQGTKE